MTRALIGVRTGFRDTRYGAFVKLRAGMTRHARVLTALTGEFGVDQRPTFGPLASAAVEFGGVLELYRWRGLLIRLEAGDLVIPEHQIVFEDNGRRFPLMAATTHAIEVGSGIGWRF